MSHVRAFPVERRMAIRRWTGAVSERGRAAGRSGTGIGHRAGAGKGLMSTGGTMTAVSGPAVTISW